jgi:hypothetical protein
VNVRERRDHAVVTAGYWAFTLSDGALRMLVLLHLHAVGRSPIELLVVLLPYEVAGVVANLAGGWLGARFGLKSTLVAGLLLQAGACAALAADPAWLTLPLVMGTQLASGIAKDLTKTGAKSYVKLLAPAGDHGALFRLVALLTGSKNALKGIGFFAGGALLATVGFRGAVLVLAAAVAGAAAAAGAWLPPAAGKAATRAGVGAVFAHERWLNWLAAARLFLFGSRDAWFAVALPLFLVADAGWSQAAVGAFLAAWVIGYGVVQALTPAVLRPRDAAAGGRMVTAWTAALLLPIATAAWLLAGSLAPGTVLVVTLAVYGALFAVDSSLHSWLVVARGGERVALQVGFYYAANALGRVAGLAASALLFAGAGEGRAGLQACLLGSAIAIAAATACSLPLRRVPPEERGDGGATADPRRGIARA